jgi:leucyl aminopeptidase
VVVALGENTAGVFGNNDALVNSLIKSGAHFQEDMWRLPITKEHKESVKGKSADISNSGKSRYGGASQAAAFLERFVEPNVKWAHMDIAGPGMARKDNA